MEQDLYPRQLRLSAHCQPCQPRRWYLWNALNTVQQMSESFATTHRLYTYGPLWCATFFLQRRINNRYFKADEMIISRHEPVFPYSSTAEFFVLPWGGRDLLGNLCAVAGESAEAAQGL